MIRVGRRKLSSTYEGGMEYDLRKLTDYLWELPQAGGMRVPARIYATEKMLPQILSDNAPQQAVNVAHLPGIVKASLAMPDIHWGYGFPIGGVAAFDLDRGVISPGGVGYDINCGVRLMASKLRREQIAPRMRELGKPAVPRCPDGCRRGRRAECAGAGVTVGCRTRRVLGCRARFWQRERSRTHRGERVHCWCRSCAGFAARVGAWPRAAWYAWFGQPFS